MHHHASSLNNKYKKLKHEVQRQIRQSYWSYIASVITPPDGSNTPKKSFWSFLRRNRTENLSISASINHDTGNLTTDSSGKAKILNSQFQSVFTQETPLTDDHKSPQQFPDIPNICI